MPKRSFDSSSAMPANERAPPVKAQKTERSHEENQERAYIAASRRADRSLEARVQSARQASEIHRRRTGRGLKVSEEIVLKEEMYEEEEDEIPRHYKYLTAHLQTNSPDMNHRVNAYITTQAAMATMARYNEVNRLFSESFPSAMAYQQHLNNSAYMGPLMNSDGTFQQRLSTSGSSQSSPATRTHSVSSQSQFSRRDSTTVGSPMSNSAATTISSPPALTPASSTDIDASESKSTPFQTPTTAFPPLHLDPQLAQQSTSSSAFTSELPNEVKMMANIDMNDPMAMHFMGDNASAFQMFGPYPGDTTAQQDSSKTNLDLSTDTFSPHDAPIQDDNFLSSIDGSMDLLDIPTGSYSRLGTPACGNAGEGWESLIDFGSEQ
ncbi:uncharacterized protein F4822DRAFT_356764 [Hypoxylon trugodes]|uniref:uncharacterized protein n=1 Tax=Hypoxylon trugodes TaxID=326681 RepID=UPI002193C009|nr:uncharacterized protein F4822DRAFT_356764 [Hypoxylon trugodes]KAI1385884.1 hypothetical protein F4822DRAFT_356764 [Hypoxylon trugodes]